MRKTFTALTLSALAAISPLIGTGTAHADGIAPGASLPTGVYLCYFTENVVVNYPGSSTPFIVAPYVVPASVTPNPADCPPGTIAIGA